MCVCVFVLVAEFLCLCRLDQNYQLEDNVCLPRSTIYEHYLDFCQRESIQPVNAASFGKVNSVHTL